MKKGGFMKKSWRLILIMVLLMGSLIALYACGVETEAESPERGGVILEKRNVIFIHPDGAHQSHFTAARLIHYGPDGELQWDRLPNVAIYKSHMKDALTGTSHGGATVHATGKKVPADSYGCDGPCDTGGRLRTIIEEARDNGYATGLVNTGTISEPGTGAFAAHVTSRKDHCEIVRQLIEESNVDVILGAGEKYYLSTDHTSTHINPEKLDRSPDSGVCKHGKNMIEIAHQRGYTVVYTKEELQKIDPTRVTKLLGIFAYHDTYNDHSERVLKKFNLINTDGSIRLYEPYAPTFAEMVDVAIKVLNNLSISRNKKGFILVAEEEGTDNFGNGGLNAEGLIEAAKRADDAIGVALGFATNNPNTLILTTADSDAGGMGILGPTESRMKERFLDANGCFKNPGLDPLTEDPEKREPLIDGITDFSRSVEGEYCEKPFLAKPSRDGLRLPFGILWFPAGAPDVGGGMIVKAFGRNADMVKGTIDNTQIYYIMKEALGL